MSQRYRLCPSVPGVGAWTGSHIGKQLVLGELALPTLLEALFVFDLIRSSMSTADRGAAKGKSTGQGMLRLS